MTDFPALLAKLKAWREHDFHADRQLADELLIADDWQCEADTSFQGGVRWFRSVGGGATYNVSEDSRPHPINDLNAAVGLIPYPPRLQLSLGRNYGHATVALEFISFVGGSPAPTVAICIAAVQAIAHKKGVPL